MAFPNGGPRSFFIEKPFNQIYKRYKRGGILNLITTSLSSNASGTNILPNNINHIDTNLNNDTDNSKRKKKSSRRTIKSFIPCLLTTTVLLLSVTFLILIYIYILKFPTNYFKLTRTTTVDEDNQLDDDRATDRKDLGRQNIRMKQQDVLRQKIIEWKKPLNLLSDDILEIYNKSEIEEANKKWPRRYIDGGGYQNEIWEKVKNDVVIGIKTGKEVASLRLQKLRSVGWWSVGRDIPNFLIISDHNDSTNGIVSIYNYGLNLIEQYNHTFMNNNDDNNQKSLFNLNNWFHKHGWRGDKDKNLPAFHILYSLYPNKKWYVLLDDDTYIFLDNFAHYITQPHFIQYPDQPIYTGKTFYISRCGGFAKDGRNLTNSQDRGMFAHGGSGIVINQPAMKLLYPSIPNCIYDYNSCWAGDMQVGLCLRRNGIKVKRFTSRKYLELNFIPFSPSKALSDLRYTSRWRSDRVLPITFHKITDQELHFISQFEKISIRNRKLSSFKSLRLYLMKNNILPAHSKKDRKNRWFTDAFLPSHLKISQ